MESFKQFISEVSYEEGGTDIEKTLSKLPKKHKDLLRGFKIKFEKGSTLDNGNKYVGEMDPENKTISIAAPYNYSREWTMLHEIGHIVYDKFMDENLRDKWQKLVIKTKDKAKQSAEELFCHAYASYFAKNKVVVHTHPEWIEFLKNNF